MNNKILIKQDTPVDTKVIKDGSIEFISDSLVNYINNNGVLKETNTTNQKIDGIIILALDSEIKKTINVSLEKPFIIDYLKFNIDEDLKKGYLKEKPVETAKGEYSTYVILDEYESLLNKPVYNFSYAERDELFFTKYNNPSLAAVSSIKSKLKGYVDYCIRQNKVIHMQNIFDTLTFKDLKKFINKQATEFKYIPKDKLKEYQDILVNPQDKWIIEALFLGIRGRTEKGSTFEELVNLEIDPTNEQKIQECELELFQNDGNFRILNVSQETMNLILDAYKQTEYYVGNDKNAKNPMGINRCSNYILCTTGKDKNGKMLPTTIGNRINKIQKWCNNSYITANNLYMSGMINKALDIYEKNGELTKQDYIDICRSYNYGRSEPEKYIYVLKANVEIQIKLIEEQKERDKTNA